MSVGCSVGPSAEFVFASHGLPACLPVCLSIFLLLCLRLGLVASMSVCLCMSLCLFVCMRLSVCLCVSLSFQPFIRLWTLTPCFPMSRNAGESPCSSVRLGERLAVLPVCVCVCVCLSSRSQKDKNTKTTTNKSPSYPLTQRFLRVDLSSVRRS